MPEKIFDEALLHFLNSDSDKSNVILALIIIPTVPMTGQKIDLNQLYSLHFKAYLLAFVEARSRTVIFITPVTTIWGKR